MARVRIRIRSLIIGYVIIALFAGAPILSLAIAGTIAQWNGCTLHEGFVNPCVVGGTEVGQTLYTMSVLGFMAIATIPIGIVLFLVWTAAWLFWALRKRRRAAVTAAVR